MSTPPAPTSSRGTVVASGDVSRDATGDAALEERVTSLQMNIVEHADLNIDETARMRAQIDALTTSTHPLVCVRSEVNTTSMNLREYFNATAHELKHYVPESTGVAYEIEQMLVESLLRVYMGMSSLPSNQCHTIIVHAQTIHGIAYSVRANFSIIHLVANKRWYPPYLHWRSLFEMPKFVNEQGEFTPQYLQLCSVAAVVPTHPMITYSHMDATCGCIGDAFERIQLRCFVPHEKLLRVATRVSNNDYDDAYV